MPPSSRIAFALLLALLPVSLFAQGNAAKGRRAFANQCASCHTPTDQNLPTGPALLGVVGRKAGTREGFAFTEAMKGSGLTWDTATLDKFLAAPTEVVPGTTMTLAVTAPAARADLIAFLNTLKPAVEAASR